MDERRGSRKEWREQGRERRKQGRRRKRSEKGRRKRGGREERRETEAEGQGVKTVTSDQPPFQLSYFQFCVIKR